MPNKEFQTAVEETEPDVASLDEYAGYDDGEWYVICEKSNPNAWIRMRETTRLEP